MDRGQRERVERAYAEWAGCYHRLMRRTYHRVERAISRAHLGRHLPRNPRARLLDAGGGDGEWCRWALAEERAGSAVLVDLSPAMLSLARRRGARGGRDPVLLRGDVGNLPVPRNAFDLAFALGGVLSHLLDPGRALEEIVRAVRPGGRIVVSVDGRVVGLRTARDARLPGPLREILRGRAVPLFHHHPFPFPVRFFSPDELRAAVEAAGVEIVSMIGKPVFTRFLAPEEPLTEEELAERVALEMAFVADPGFLPYADQIEVIGVVA